MLYLTGRGVKQDEKEGIRLLRQSSRVLLEATPYGIDPAVLARLTAAIEAGEERYVRAVVSEALRLRPVVPLAGRRL